MGLKITVATSPGFLYNVPSCWGTELPDSSSLLLMLRHCNCIKFHSRKGPHHREIYCPLFEPDLCGEIKLLWNSRWVHKLVAWLLSVGWHRTNANRCSLQSWWDHVLFSQQPSSLNCPLKTLHLLFNPINFQLNAHNSLWFFPAHTIILQQFSVLYLYMV